MISDFVYFYLSQISGRYVCIGVQVATSVTLLDCVGFTLVCQQDQASLASFRPGSGAS